MNYFTEKNKKKKQIKCEQKKKKKTNFGKLVFFFRGVATLKEALHIRWSAGSSMNYNKAK